MENIEHVARVKLIFIIMNLQCHSQHHYRVFLVYLLKIRSCFKYDQKCTPSSRKDDLHCRTHTNSKVLR